MLEFMKNIENKYCTKKSKAIKKINKQNKTL